MIEREHEFIIIYGDEQWKHWDGVVDLGPILFDGPIEGFPVRILKRGSTMIAFAQHPQYVRRDAYWVGLGNKVRTSKFIESKF
jgi:hypothetical protein